MLKIIALCGSRVKDGNVLALLQEALSQPEIQGAAETEIITLADKKIGPCLHCNWCLKHQTPGRPCVQEDDMGPIYQKLLAADGIIAASPAHFGRLSGLMADVLDRTRAFVHGNLYQFPLKNKVGGSVAVAFFRGGRSGDYPGQHGYLFPLPPDDPGHQRPGAARGRGLRQPGRPWPV